MNLKIGTKIRILRVLQEDAHYDKRNEYEGKEGIIESNFDLFKDSFSGGLVGTHFHRVVVEVLEVPKEKHMEVLEGVTITKNASNNFFTLRSDDLYFTLDNFPPGEPQVFTKVTLEWEE